MVILKRDGTIVEFDRHKVLNAMKGAAKDAKITLSKDFKRDVLSQIEDGMWVEEIQDLIVFNLQKHKKYKRVAEHFNAHRMEKYAERKEAQKLEGIFKGIMKNGSDENSNKPSHLPNVKRDLIAGEYFRYDASRFFPAHMWNAHKTKQIHLHDSDFITMGLTNCCVFNLEDMLNNGTRINNADIEKPRSILTATNIATQIVANIAHQQYGGISIANFNETLAEYGAMSYRKHLRDAIDLLGFKDEITYSVEYFDSVKDYQAVYSLIFPTMVIVDGVLDTVATEKATKRADEIAELFGKAIRHAAKKTKKEIFDAMQLYEYQSNSISSANQTPFSTIMFTVPTSWISECIVESYFKVRMGGLGAQRKIAIFPKINYVVVDGYNLKEGDKYFELTQLASKCISKCFYPDILHYSREKYEKGIYTARMGCRSKPSEEFFDENGNFVPYGRFNWGVVTHNLPQLALKTLETYGADEDKFFELLDKEMEFVGECLVHRYEMLKDIKAKNAPILFQYGAIARLDPEDTIEPLLRTKLSSVSYGYFGLDDVVRLLKDNNTIKEEGKFAEKIMKTIYDFTVRLGKEKGLPISVYGTPFESLIHNAFEKDMERYFRAMPKWLIDRGYYTNSYHYSSELPTDAFTKLDSEQKFIKYTNGGNINYSEIGNVRDNPTAILELIQYGHEIGMEYQAFNVRADACYECGHEGEIDYDVETGTHTCPSCGNTDPTKMNVIKRCCGYLANYNERKAPKRRMKEINSRAIHV